MNWMYFTLRYWTHIYRDRTFSKSGCFHYYVEFAWKRTTFSYFNRCLCPVRSYSTVVAAALSCSGVYPGQLLEWNHRDVRAVPHWQLHQHWRTDGMYAMRGRTNHTTAWSNTVLWWVWPFTQRNACGEKMNLHAWKIQTQKRLKRMLFIRTKHNMQILGVIPFSMLQNHT